jgi:hypothetical protein
MEFLACKKKVWYLLINQPKGCVEEIKIRRGR